MGPPKLPPNTLRRSFGRSTPLSLLKKSFAVKIVLRWNSKADPCHEFVPLLVTRLICAADDRPSSELAFTVTTRNSSMASEFSRSTGLLTSQIGRASCRETGYIDDG